MIVAICFLFRLFFPTKHRNILPGNQIHEEMGEAALCFVPLLSQFALYRNVGHFVTFSQYQHFAIFVALPALGQDLECLLCDTTCTSAMTAGCC